MMTDAVPPELEVAPQQQDATSAAPAAVGQQQQRSESASSDDAGVAVEAESSSLLSLSWEDFPHSVARALRTLQEEEEFVDVTLACHARQFNAHKVILSACSPYFRKLLKVRKGQGNVLVVCESSSRYFTLRDLWRLLLKPDLKA